MIDNRHVAKVVRLRTWDSHAQPVHGFGWRQRTMVAARAAAAAGEAAVAEVEAKMGVLGVIEGAGAEESAGASAVATAVRRR